MSDIFFANLIEISTKIIASAPSDEFHLQYALNIMLFFFFFALFLFGLGFDSAPKIFEEAAWLAAVRKDVVRARL